MGNKTEIFLKLIVTGLIIITAVMTYALPSYDDVLVVINDDSESSVKIGNYFVEQRHVPAINVYHIRTEDKQARHDTNQMTPDAEAKAIDDIRNYLVNNALEDKINYIALTRGIPFWVSHVELSGTSHLFDKQLLSSLANLKYGSGSIFKFNPFYYYINENYLDLVNYKFTKKKYGYYIVTRLDGPGISGAKQQIDSSGYPAYHAYDKDNIKYLVIPPKFYGYNMPIQEAEINLRTNIKLVYPTMYGVGGEGDTLRDVAKGISFAYFDWVGWETEFTKWYSNGEASSVYPSIYRGIEFLPGGIVEAFRSNPAVSINRSTGGVVEVDFETETFKDFRKYISGDDLRFRHLTCVAYDPVNDWVWCGTGDSPFDEYQVYSDNKVGDIAKQKYAKHRGGGIGIFKAGTGDIVKHFSPDSTTFYTPDASELTNARVGTVVYDKYDKLMWIGHYEGIQYYDLQNHTWHSIPALTNNFAASSTIYVDPFDTDKVYFAFYYEDGINEVISSQINGARTQLFEYSKSTKTVKTYTISSLAGALPLISKTSADIIWVTWGKSLIKYKLSTATVLQTIDLQDVVKDETVKDATGNDQPIITPILYPRGLVSTTNSNNEKIVCVAFTTSKVAKSTDLAPMTAYVLRVKETGETVSTNTLIHHPDWEFAYGMYQWLQSFIVDPNDLETLYLRFSSTRTGIYASKSTDGGATWEKFDSKDVYFSDFNKVLAMTVGENGKLYIARGSYVGQQIVGDFILDGAVATGGGMIHASMYYDENDHSEFSQPAYNYLGGAYTGDSPGTIHTHTAQAQVQAMMFMLLDGYSIADARFGIFKNYPQHGSNGHMSHMVVIPPKCAPFAPRVDEDNTDFNVIGYNVIEIILDSPGLIESMDGFFPSTINSTTVKLFDNNSDLVEPSTYTMVYNPIGNKITLTGHFTKSSYSVTLKCGNDGIKNIKGAPMLNTRKDEFKDEISYSFSNRAQSETTPPSIPTGLSQVVNPEAVEFSWNDSSDASGIDHYELVLSDSSDFSTPVFTGNPTTSSFSTAVWAVGVSNYWRVRAQDTEGNVSGWSEVQSFTALADTTPPSVPVGLDQIVNSESIDFSWDDSTDAFGVTAYEVALSDNSSFSTTTFTGSPADSEISADVWTYGVTNYWRVRALDAAGNKSDWSEVQSFDGPADTTPPSIPADLKYDISSGNINFDWSDSTDASGIAGYEINVVSIVNWTIPVFIGTPTESNISTAIWDHGGFTHFWKVRAQDTEGNWSNWTSYIFFTIPADTTPPSVPVGLGQVVNSHSIDFDWDDSTDDSGVESYEIVVSGSSDFSTTVFTGTPLDSNLSTTVWGYDVTNYWKVRAKDTAGNVSDWSEVKTFTGPPVPPAGTLEFSAGTYTVAEDGTTATITVNRAGGSYGAVSVDYATGSGTASSGSDYTVASGTLNWAGGDAAAKTF
ncbi:MAG: hypothetical protein L3J71_05095, partial [Victivallaceae bacterium]|nr:hypothetical protein [Victivallaceae bacterium]